MAATAGTAGQWKGPRGWCCRQRVPALTAGPWARYGAGVEARPAVNGRHREAMKPTHNAAPADPVLLALLAMIATGWALWTLARLLLLAAAALLVLLGWRPAPRPAAPQPQPVAPAAVVEASPALIAASEAPTLLPPSPAPLERLRVVELRALARAAGLPRTLSRSGRRADLLEALAAAC